MIERVLVSTYEEGKKVVKCFGEEGRGEKEERLPSVKGDKRGYQP